jgi:mannose-6-phosphate isomerase class I
MDKITLRDGRKLTSEAGPSTAQVLVAVTGGGVLESCGANPIAFSGGEAVVVPANIREYSIKGQWTVEVLRAMVPGPEASEPETSL